MDGGRKYTVLIWFEDRSTQARSEQEKGSHGEILLLSIGLEWDMASDSGKSALQCKEAVGLP